MKPSHLTERVLLSALFAAALTSVQASDLTNRPPLELQPREPESRYRVSVTYRLGYNMPVTFKRIGIVAPNSNPGQPAGTGLFHTYDNGYVVPDTRQVSDNYTWNWGFDNPSQVQPGDGTPYGSLVLQSSSSPGTSHDQDNFQHGFEVAFSRQIGKIGRCRWGLEGAFNFLDLTVHDNDNLFGPVTTVTDTYALDGLNPFMPPPAPPNTPYRGSPGGGYPGGGGPLITDFPASRAVQTVPGETTIIGSRNFDATVFGLRVGPYLEMPVSESVSFMVSGGFALAYVDSDYRFRETSSLAGVGVANPFGSGSRGVWMPGGFVAGNVSVALSKQWALTAGAQFMDVGHYTETVNGQQATLDLSQALFVTLGISYSF